MDDAYMTRQVIQLFGQIFGRAGWSLIVILFVVISTTFFYLPSMFSMVGIAVPKRWPSVTLSVIMITVATWVGTLITSIARVIVWIRLKFAMTSGNQWKREKEDVLAIQRLSMWLLGLFTVLAAYLTQWFGGGE